MLWNCGQQSQLCSLFIQRQWGGGSQAILKDFYDARGSTCNKRSPSPSPQPCMSRATHTNNKKMLFVGICSPFLWLCKAPGEVNTTSEHGQAVTAYTTFHHGSNTTASTVCGSRAGNSSNILKPSSYHQLLRDRAFLIDVSYQAIVCCWNVGERLFNRLSRLAK